MTTRAHEWRRGWPVVAAAMIGNGFGPGLFQNLSSLFTPGMSATFGWTRGDIATASGFGMLGALLLPWLGRLGDRFGVRAVIIAAMLLLGAAYLAMAAQTGALWEYQALVFCLALSVAGTSAIVYGKLIAARFVQHRGFALAMATSGLSITTLLLPPVIGAAIAAWSWRGGFALLGAIVVCVSLPLILFAIRGFAVGPAAIASQPPVEIAGLTPQQARRTGRFWRFVASGLLINVATVGLVTQLVPFGIDHGLGAADAALLLVAFGASQVVGRFSIGILVDHFRPQWMGALFAAFSAAGFALLLAGPSGLAPLMGAVFIAGLMHGADNDLMPFLTARLFGLRGYGEIYGMVLMSAIIGSAGGIVGFGRLHDLTGGYTLALGAATAAMTLAAVLLLTLDDDQGASA